MKISWCESVLGNQRVGSQLLNQPATNLGVLNLSKRTCKCSVGNQNSLQSILNVPQLSLGFGNPASNNARNEQHIIIISGHLRVKVLMNDHTAKETTSHGVTSEKVLWVASIVSSHSDKATHGISSRIKDKQAKLILGKGGQMKQSLLSQLKTKQIKLVKWIHA